MVLRAVAVGAALQLGILLNVTGCARNAPVVAPTVVTVNGVAGGGELATLAAPPDYGGTWKARDEVEAEWHGSWWPALVLEKRGGHWMVHYEGYGSEWDEVVGGDRIRERRAEPQMQSDPDPDDEPDP